MWIGFVAGGAKRGCNSQALFCTQKTVVPRVERVCGDSTIGWKRRGISKKKHAFNASFDVFVSRWTRWPPCAAAGRCEKKIRLFNKRFGLFIARIAMRGAVVGMLQGAVAAAFFAVDTRSNAVMRGTVR